ncbi:TPA: hypothetical protein U4V51_001729 [Streptococcus agalactiae]|uniref:Uncharacterized protein n=3 Tax=Streptococcus TaxID=1301 RepID=A0A7Z6RBK9_STRAG|nr:hypothetical protein [Streptococcus agalactiae]EAO74058.1 conserved hypothetical protein [Streptococcus agalactiae CJB111]EPU50764.1 hypothetical protein SAG0214_08785 [Streptococcus agalactiae str. Gottschalk 992B]EPU64196.1 hypothetical protein SAG0305_08495 [Streptococcus agalactiae GB00020]EPU90880.1 hypothetical protein SAG0319_02980 [Streptococcus agalactiae GB00241]EPV20518.1 hypothetical protein SAG0333_07645 [Streptococcus agalactiae GB00614]
MTNKTYFMRSFNLILYLFLFAPICSAFGWLFNYLSVQLTNITFVNLDTVKSITDIISSVCHGFALISLLLALFLVGLEIIQRLKTDSLWNYIQSVYHTFLLRHFLFQRERVQKISNLEHQTVTTINPIHNGFNRAVRKCIVDIRKDTITIFLKVPRDQQGQKILKEMEAQLKEEIVSQHADYYFSSPIRVRNQLWFTEQKLNPLGLWLALSKSQTAPFYILFYHDLLG